MTDVNSDFDDWEVARELAKLGKFVLYCIISYRIVVPRIVKQMLQTLQSPFKPGSPFGPFTFSQSKSPLPICSPGAA